MATPMKSSSFHTEGTSSGISLVNVAKPLLLAALVFSAEPAHSVSVTSANIARPAQVIPLFCPSRRQSENTARVVHEIRNLSGLTWEEVAILFGVSRRAIHNWASGEMPSAGNEQDLRKVLSLIRFIDTGTARSNRNVLLSNDATGRSLYERIKNREEVDAFGYMTSSADYKRQNSSLASIDKAISRSKQLHAPKAVADDTIEQNLVSRPAKVLRRQRSEEKS